MKNVVAQYAFETPRLGHRLGRCVPGLLALIAGCGGGTVAPTAMQSQIAPVLAAPIMITAHLADLPVGVTTEDTTCVAAASDTCDGRDDDCDGRIDEGCGWESGPVQITLAWDSGADLDLYVTDPSGFTISYLDRSSPSGGTLDHDARGACIPGGAAIENVHWPVATPPSGNYRVDVHYWGDCGVAGSTPAHVTVSVGGRVLGTFDLVLEIGQRRATVAFTI